MVSIASLWLPILLSAVFVFIASSVIHMVLGYHANDLRQVPNESGMQEALRPFNLAPGDYGLPKPASAAAMRDPAFVEKRQKGPVAFITVIPSGAPSMGPALGLWF